MVDIFISGWFGVKGNGVIQSQSLVHVKEYRGLNDKSHHSAFVVKAQQFLLTETFVLFDET